MENVSEHNTKHEGEGHNGKDSRVGLLEFRNAVSVHNFLKRHEDVIGVEERWNHILLLLSPDYFPYLRPINVPSLPYFIKSIIKNLLLIGRAPH